MAQSRRARLHALVDALPEGEIDDVEQLLATFTSADPALRAALIAPIDDEPVTPADAAAIDRAKREIVNGEYVSDDDLDDILSPAAR
jgi:hypothetical protein